MLVEAFICQKGGFYKQSICYQKRLKLDIWVTVWKTDMDYQYYLLNTGFKIFCSTIISVIHQVVTPVQMRFVLYPLHSIYIFLVLCRLKRTDFKKIKLLTYLKNYEPKYMTVKFCAMLYIFIFCTCDFFCKHNQNIIFQYPNQIN